MNSSPTLSTAPFEHPAMDYAFLRREGIRHLERLVGQVWTDFNAHDPGITILEPLCYALTDLAHRINYDLPDLLARSGADSYDSLYSPAQVLTSNPVTLTDLRKLIIDVEGVKNAWIEKVDAESLYYRRSDSALNLKGDPLTTEPIRLKGLYRVLIELSDLLYADSQLDRGGEIVRQVARRLHAHRPLGEDFDDILILERQKIDFTASIEIEGVEDAEAVLLQIYRQVADFISPSVRFYSLSQLFEAGKRVDEIFDGPLLAHGYIDRESLRQAQRPAVLRTSDLIREIMDVPGVRAVRNITVSDGGPEEPWSLDLDPKLAPKLVPESCQVMLERNRLPVSVDVDRVLAAYARELRQMETAHKPPHEGQALLPPPGRDRNAGHYYSIQHQFPATYGVGAMGLPESASPERRAQAKQLKAYLLFFDQLLANYFAQLAHVKDLFSFSGPAGPTYFSQPIDDPSLGLDGLRELEPAHQGRLQQITEDPYGSSEAGRSSEAARRRHRFLNHLLARFAEQFTDYSLILYGLKPAGEELAQAKQRFLQDYPRLSRARGTGFNYLAPRSSENLSGLEQRLRRKLGIQVPEERFYIVEHILLRPMSGDNRQHIPILAEPRLKDPYSLQLSFVFPDWPPRYRQPDDSGKVGFRAFVERTVREETPAHLVPYIHWLDRPAMDEFEAAYHAWLDRQQSYWTRKVGG
jgi:hypothetical protein